MTHLKGPAHTHWPWHTFFTCERHIDVSPGYCFWPLREIIFYQRNKIQHYLNVIWWMTLRNVLNTFLDRCKLRRPWRLIWMKERNDTSFWSVNNLSPDSVSMSNTSEHVLSADVRCDINRVAGCRLAYTMSRASQRELTSDITHVVTDTCSSSCCHMSKCPPWTFYSESAVCSWFIMM